MIVAWRQPPWSSLPRASSRCRLPRGPHPPFSRTQPFHEHFHHPRCWNPLDGRIAVVGHRWYALLKRMMKLWKRMVQVCVYVCVCWSWRIRGEMKGWRGERFAPPGFHDSSLSPVFKAWQLVSLSALFACLFHGPPPSHFTTQGYCKSMHEIAMTNIWAGGSGCRVSSIEIPSFFEFLVRRFLSGKEKERKLVGNIFLKWIF